MTIDHAERRTRLGATDVAAIIGASPWRTPWDVWAEKTGRLQDDRDNSAMSAGRRLESAVLDEAESLLGQLERDIIVRAPDGIPVAATLDARVIATGEPVEAKTSGIVGPLHGLWGEQGTDEIPEQYLMQCLTQLLCCPGAAQCHMTALLGGRGFVRYTILRDEHRAVIDDLAAFATDWWALHVVRGKEPERVSAVPDTFKRLVRIPNKIIAGGELEQRAVDQWHRLREARIAAERAEKEAQAAVWALLYDAEACDLPDGRRVQITETHRRGYEVAPATIKSLKVRKPKCWRQIESNQEQEVIQA